MLHEPTTTLTDYLLAAQALWLALRALRLPADRGGACRVWAGLFASVGLSAACGGTSHGFGPGLHPGARLALWLATLAGIGVGNCCLLLAVARARVAGGWRAALQLMAVLKLGVYAAGMSARHDFAWTVLDSALSAGVALAIELRALRLGRPGAGALVAALVWGGAATALQQARVGLHAHFNHNDLYHVAQMLTLGLFFRAARAQAAVPRTAPEDALPPARITPRAAARQPAS